MERDSDILRFWKERNIFKKTLENTKKGKPFVFYDGPPFATGLPHYGHLLAGTIKDVIPRYQTMRGRYVRREWGWDCHGLPLENVVEEELGLKHKKDIIDFGIERFNETAKKAVLRYEKDWQEIIPKTGRFVDMEKPYKTMDASYTESVWWAFKELWNKKYIYEGYKAMLVCPRCETTLAQSEVALGGYHDVTDITVTAKFELVDEPGTYLLAWTTTPWTLPGNVALAVNKSIKYSLVQIPNGKYIVSSNLVGKIFTTEVVKIEKEFSGKDLVGKSYKPVFDYYRDTNLKNKDRAWKVYAADFVTTDEGTGIVHIAPAFGEDDLNLAQKENLPVIQHVGMDGKIKDEVKDFKGLYVKQKGDTQSTDIEILKYLSAKGTLFSKEKIVHSYPLCWRCETPLINYATSSWFVKVTAFKEKLIKENKKIKWVPEHMRDGRFGKWLEAARDWAISRTRFWGAPLPVWRCVSCKEMEVFGSLTELQARLSKSKNRYFVVRHGESLSNIQGVIDSYGDPKNHLTDKGIDQSKKAGQILKKSSITKIFTSPLIRARETAEIIAKEIGLSENKIFSEKRFSEFDHGKELQGEKSVDKTTDASEQGDLRTHIDGSENLLDLRSRLIQAMFEIDKNNENENILIVTHGSPVWMLLTGVNNLSEQETFEFRKKRENRDGYFIKNTDPEEFKFLSFPHNRVGELDYHRPYIDEVKLKCKCGGEMSRIPDVFDCWFESGSMPYGQFHYPFENKKLFKENFPAEFIAEGLDQTRGWFYSMLVLSVGLFGETPYKHVVVNGLVLGEEGKKLSKRLKNYADPAQVMEKYGADALRYYLISSPAVRGEDIIFLEKGVDEVYKKLILRLRNILSFYETYSAELKEKASWKNSKHVLDRWILSRLAELSKETTVGFDNYELDAASRPLDAFIDDFSTWYLRRSRERMKGDDEKDKECALATTRFVIFELSKLLAPLMPFLAEELYQKVKDVGDKESVHLENWPKTGKPDEKLNTQMKLTREMASKGLLARAKSGIKVRQPLAVVTLGKHLDEPLQTLLKEELNVKEVVINTDWGERVEFDENLTQELVREGELREIIRSLQELRKKALLTPRDKADLIFSGNEQGVSFIKLHESELKKSVLLGKISQGEAEGETLDIGGMELRFSLKKK